MSVKWFVALVVVGAVIVGSVDGPQPDPATADPDVLAAAVMPEGARARIAYGFGAIGAHAVSGTVLSMTANTQRELDAIRPKLKKLSGADGNRARAAALTVDAANRMAIQGVYTAHPVKAVQSAFKAKDYLQIAIGNLRTSN